MIEGIVQKYQNKISLQVIQHNDLNVYFSYNSKSIVPAASVIKILIMANALDRDKICLNQIIGISDDNVVDYSLSTELLTREYSFYDLLYLMMTVSDNSAANQLIDYLGMDKINQYAKSMGMNDTNLQRKFMDMKSKSMGIDNVTTLDDMMILIEKIRKKELLNSQLMIKMLQNNRDRSKLARFNSEDDFLAHKTGLNEKTFLDIGFDEKITIGIFINGCDHESQASDDIGKIYKWYKEWFNDGVVGK
ncbi:MAG: serine hydrolase [Clostridiales bacterium]|nr:serine hydrolase [Clostridiales bacterium]